VARDVVGQFLNLLANDTDADGDSLRVTSVTCQTGTVLISNGQAYYTPTASNRGFDICNYSITDGKGGVANSRATLYIR
jgi:large repetitive protein